MVKLQKKAREEKYVTNEEYCDTGKGHLVKTHKLFKGLRLYL